MNKIFNNRRFKHGSLATISTIIVIAVVVIINVIASIILDRLPTQIDLTENQMYTINEESIEFLETLETDIKVYICMPEDDLIAAGQIFEQANQIINDYTRYSDNVNINYINLLENPTFAQQYSEYDISSTSIIVESENRTKLLDVNLLFETSTDSTTQEQLVWSNAEKLMTSAMMYVSDEEVTKVVMLTGHQEVSVDSLTAILEENNYEVTTQNIMTEEIDQEADMLIIASPLTDYSEDELKKLDTYLDNNAEFGKNIMYIAGVTQPELPNLEVFLEEWGVILGEGILFETDPANVYLNSNFVFGTSYGAETDTYTEDLRQVELPFLAVNTRPVELAFDEKDNRSTTVLLESNDTTVLVPNDADETFDPYQEEQSSYPVAVLGQRMKYEGTTLLTSTVMVFGSDAMFSEVFVTSASYNNNELTINTVNKLAGKEESINIVSVDFSTESLQITWVQYLAVAIIFMGVVPVACLILGGVVWIRRRNK